MRCRICNSTRIKIIDAATQNLFECRSCRFVFKTGAKTVYEDLPAESYTIYNFDRALEVQEIAKAIKKYHPNFKNMNLLEIGCGTGVLLSEFRKLGMNVYGFEPSSIGATIARTQFQLTNIKNEYFRSNSFGVTPHVYLLYDVLEHLDNECELFSAVSGAMDKDSVFVVRSGNPASINARLFPAKWMYFAMDQHVAFHCKTSLDILCRKTDLKLVKFHSFRHAYGGWALKNLAENIVKGLLFRLVPSGHVIHDRRITLAHDHFIAIIQKQ